MRKSRELLAVKACSLLLAGTTLWLGGSLVAQEIGYDLPECPLVPSAEVPHFGTFWLARGPFGNGGPPLPCLDTKLDGWSLEGLPVYALPNGQFLVDDSEIPYRTSRTKPMSMATESTDPPPLPGDPGEGEPLPPPPDIPNFAKYMAHAFFLLDANRVALADTNLYHALISLPEGTNNGPNLQVARYGTNCILIRANHFDYSTETDRDFALLVSDKAEAPLWKEISLSGADGQDGWLVQGSVPRWKVADPMFMMVSNINLSYPAFFHAIPYGGPHIELTGLQPYETVSGTIALQANVTDLSGVTNEQFEVTVDGLEARYSFGPSNMINIDTRYNNSGYVNVYLRAFNQARVYDPINPPDQAKLAFSATTSLPLVFENDTYLAFASDMCPTEVGTNYVCFVISQPREIEATISDPSSGQVVAAYSGYVPFASTVLIPWNFTQADGVSEYTNDNYAVTFAAAGSASLAITNTISRTGVRTAAGCFMTYGYEDPADLDGDWLNWEAEDWIKGTLANLYEDMYRSWSLTQYTPGVVGANRNHGVCEPRDPWSINWEYILRNLTNAALFSDLTLGPAHGNGAAIGGGYIGGTFDPWTLGLKVRSGGGKNWRLRKAALWTCYSGDLALASGGVYNTSWPDACGIEPTSVQQTSYMRKNCGLFFGGELIQRGYGGNAATSTAKVEETLDEIWIGGKYLYPGGCDPTYSWDFAINGTRGMYNPELDFAIPLRGGYPYMVYSSLYEDELMMLDTTHVKTQ